MTDSQEVLDFPVAKTDAFANVEVEAIPDRHVVYVAGGKDAVDDNSFHVVFSVLNAAHRTKTITLLVTGGGNGGDTLVKEWAAHNEVRLIEYPISKEEWDKNGSSAGPIRTRRVLREQKPDVTIGFTNRELAQDRAVASVLEIAGNINVPTHLFRTDTGTREF